jgi:two-component system NtrC family sensor kinase
MRQAPDADLDGKLAVAQRELSEALERQAAADEVLRVIASSPGELEPIFETILSKATQICEAQFGYMFRFHDGALHPAAVLRVPQALASPPIIWASLRATWPEFPRRVLSQS